MSYVDGNDLVQREILIIHERGRVRGAKFLWRLGQMKPVYKWNGEAHRSLSPFASWASLREPSRASIAIYLFIFLTRLSAQ